jgi:hypothetical protein
MFDMQGGEMSKTRSRNAIAATLFSAAIFLSGSTAQALPRGNEPRDPITRIVKYIKHVLRVVSNDEGMTPPKP